jgi:uncharacterized protein (TIGR00255 family)
MTVASMTGFARAEGHADGTSWVWELKSVNSKSLDLRFRLPPGFEALELPLRTSLAKHLRRGNVAVSLTVARTAAGGGLRVNREALAQVLALVRELEGSIEAAPPRIDGLLALRGILEAGDAVEDEAARERLNAALLASWETALSALQTMREAEGSRLLPTIEARLDEIDGLTADAERCAAAQPAQIRQRLSDLLKELLEAVPALPEERLVQEAALIAAKADIREELDRLTAHVGGARALVAEGTAIGRRFDFLCQEFNREANTLCSKSADVALTRVGLGLKAAIEQLREQVQNIE